ncbi:MAG TPA: hypothetical protein VF808_10650 [Ktedonobacterales bacterium]
MRVGRLVYWFVTGACFGLGLDMYVLGTLCLAGGILLLVGGVALRGREVVATVLGLGVGFAAVLPLLAYTPFQGGAPSVPLVYMGLVVFTLILVGVVALVVAWRIPQRGAGPSAS